ncbi:DHHW family protein [Fictibacillus phosphorivorans]|uniref:DHHW family protein n=1 Tax=Fictibacillus phosphorivorans TaxID=1221500 RepID=UPI0011A77C1F|nr:DHHW family protein [Fictibacillus phosphorivorans]
MRKIIGEKVLAVAFVGLISTVGVGMVLAEDTKISELENREMASFPLVEKDDDLLSGEYFGKFETYYNDQVYKREEWLQLYSSFKKEFMKEKEVNGVFLGEDGYLLQAVDKIENLKDEHQQINKFIEYGDSKGLDVYYTMAPTKVMSNKDKLPAFAEDFSQKNMNNFLEGLSPKAEQINLRKTIEKKNQEEQLYFYTDHHWKQKAAFYGYQQVIKELSEKHPEVGEPKKFSDFNVKTYKEPEFYGSAARLSNKAYAEKADQIEIMEPKEGYDGYDVCIKGECGQPFYDLSKQGDKEMYADRYNVYMGGNASQIVVKNEKADNDLKVLVLKDSYANPMIPLLSAHFKEVHVVDLRLNGGNMYDYLNKQDLDMVLFVHNVSSAIQTPNLYTFEGRSK